MMTEGFTWLYQRCHPQVAGGWMDRLHVYSLLRFIVRLSANVFLPLWYILSCHLRYRTHEESEFVVTLTSFPARIDKVWLTIESVMRQTYPARHIILWLSRDQFPGEMSDLPWILRKMCDRGLEIRFCDGDIRSHKKYLYLLQQHPEQTIVTMDDDIFYTERLLQMLHKQHLLYPNDVIAAYTHQMTYDKDGRLKPYVQWNHHTTASSNLFFGSGGGTCFPAGVFYHDVCDEKKALSTCPLADDVWLNAQVRLAGNRVRRIPLSRPYHFVEIMRFNDICLSDKNVFNTQQNDAQINNVEREYARLGGPVFAQE